MSDFVIKIHIYKIDSGYMLKDLNSENRISSVSMYIFNIEVAFSTWT